MGIQAHTVVSVSGFRVLAWASMFYLLIGAFDAIAQTSTPRWTFVSSPDWFNADVADLSGSTPGVPEAPGWDRGASDGLNGISPQMRQVYEQLVGEMSAYSPQLFVVAGDQVNGRWFGDATHDMFDPGSRNRARAIDTAADIYYRWYRRLFSTPKIVTGTVLATIGDHEIGDDDWPSGSEKSRHVDVMKRAFARNMVDMLGLPARVNGARSRPIGTQHEHGSYAYQHRNVLFVTVDVFRQLSPTRNIHPRYRTVSPEVVGAHLDWLDDILSAADSDPGIDHVIVQGHVPVLPPVRMQRTSGTMLVDREDSGFWQTLRRHDHRRGGKVRLYLSGEVHAVTASKDSDGEIVQLVHGDPPRGARADELPEGNYVVFTVRPERIDAELRRFVLQENGNSRHWQPSEPRTSGPSSASPSTQRGSLTIDTSRSSTRYTTSGDLRFVDQAAPAVHFGFDATTRSGNFSNEGEIGNDFYEGVANGMALTRAGKFGDAIQLNGSNAFVESGRGNITEGESRTVSAWVQTSAGGTRTVLSYGADKGGINGRFNFRLASGRPQVNISPSRTCTPAEVPRVNDGAWHHLAVVLTDDHDNRCADLLFYVDGREFSASSSNSGAVLSTLPWANYRIGVDRSGSAGFFDGRIDDVTIWAIPLTGSKTRALATAGDHPDLRYDALAMQSLFALFDARQSSVSIGGRTWSYATGLNGSGGDVLSLGNDLAIQLDKLGNGVSSGSGQAPPPPPPPEDDLYEAEAAERSAAFRAVDFHAGFTGSGYVDYVREGFVEWTVTAATMGAHELVFRYALGSGNRPLRIQVIRADNGATLTSSPLAFPATGGWNNWDEARVTVDLGAGRYRVRAQTTGSSGPNIDSLRLGDGNQPPPLPPASGLFEAEGAARSPAFRAVDFHSGFTGSAYVDYVREGFVEWTVTAATAGVHELVFRYALGSGNRPLRIRVIRDDDGATLPSSLLAFPATGGWNNWDEARVTADLSAGDYRVRAQTTGSSGPNMDHLRVLPDS